MQRDTSVDCLKGLAIIAVIGLHIIPFFVNSRNVFSERSQGLLEIMNYFRFAVPFFVALSGYSLAKKYLTTSLVVKNFLTVRILKLLPQYFFWVAVIYLIVHMVPGWSGFVDSFPLWQVIVLGRGEYHLYFVPMIISLYLLFPILLWLVKKLGVIAVFLALLIQIWFYWYLANVVIHDPAIKFLQSDQQQYVFFVSWIFYFVFGIYLGMREWSQSLWLGAVALPLLATSVRWTVSETRELLNFGYNIIFASGFTRLSVILLSVSGLISGLVFIPRLIAVLGIIFRPLAFLGRYSFIIYLSHTIILRMWWAVYFYETPSKLLFGPGVIWIAAVILTLRPALVINLFLNTRAKLFRS